METKRPASGGLTQPERGSDEPEVIDKNTSPARNQCVLCGTQATPQWRHGPTGPRTLCNACGIRMHRRNARACADRPQNKVAITKRRLTPDSSNEQQDVLSAKKIRSQRSTGVGGTEVRISTIEEAPSPHAMQLNDLSNPHFNPLKGRELDVRGGREQCGDEPLPGPDVAAILSMENTKRVAFEMRRHPREEHSSLPPMAKWRALRDRMGGANRGPTESTFVERARTTTLDFPNRSSLPSPSQGGSFSLAKSGWLTDCFDDDPKVGEPCSAMGREFNAAIQLMSLSRASPENRRPSVFSPGRQVEESDDHADTLRVPESTPTRLELEAPHRSSNGRLSVLEDLYTEVVRAEWEWQAAEKAVQAVAKSLAAITADAVQAKKRYRKVSEMFNRSVEAEKAKNHEM